MHGVQVTIFGEVLEVEVPGQRKSVYLITVSHPVSTHSATGEELKAPDNFSRIDLLNAILHSFQRPVYTNSGNQAAQATGNRGTVRVLKMVIFAENHQADESGQAHRHYHVGLKADVAFFFAPYKRALLRYHGIASNWSCKHDGYFSVVRYGAWASPKKPIAALDTSPVAWKCDGPHEPLHEACQEPTTAAAVTKRRLNAELKAAEEGKEAPRPSDIDVWPIVVRHKIRNTHDNREAHLRLIEVALDTCSPAMVKYLFANRRRLPGLIDDVWQWEEVHHRVELSGRTRMQCLTEAMSAQCCCGGRWLPWLQQVLQANGIDPCLLAHDFHENFLKGRCETVPVIVLTGIFGGEGKSLILAPIVEVLGEDYVQEGVASGNFPLVDIENKKAIILNEWKFNSSILPLGLQLLWFEGKAVPVNRPQGSDAYYGHFKYKGTAPVFVTASLKHMEPLMKQAQMAMAQNQPSELTMLMRRLHIFKFTVRTAPPPQQMAPCKSCFAQFVLEGEACWCQRGS